MREPLLSTFFLDGISARDLGIQLQSPISFSGAQPKINTVSVPGRNGDLHFNEQAYFNKTAKASCFLLKENAGMALDQVAKWMLLGSGDSYYPGYRILELEDDPEYYHMVRVTNGPEIEIRMKFLAPFTINFDCMPQKFRKDGGLLRKFDRPFTLYNEGFPSLPLIKVYGNGSGVLQIGTYAVRFLELNEYTVLDCETQNAYKGSKNKNNTIYAPEFPRLEPGETHISWTGGIQKIEIAPRWWTL